MVYLHNRNCSKLNYLHKVSAHCHSTLTYEKLYWVGWYIWVYRFFQYISRRLSERGRYKRNTTDERRNSQRTTTRTLANTVGPCPIIIKISRTFRNWNLQSTNTWPDHPTTLISITNKLYNSQSAWTTVCFGLWTGKTRLATNIRREDKP